MGRGVRPNHDIVLLHVWHKISKPKNPTVPTLTLNLYELPEAGRSSKMELPRDLQHETPRPSVTKVMTGFRRAFVGHRVQQPFAAGGALRVDDHLDGFSSGPHMSFAPTQL